VDTAFRWAWVNGDWDTTREPTAERLPAHLRADLPEVASPPAALRSDHAPIRAGSYPTTQG
jgi:hypothetical protein